MHTQLIRRRIARWRGAPAREIADLTAGWACTPPTGSRSGTRYWPTPVSAPGPPRRPHSRVGRAGRSGGIGVASHTYTLCRSLDWPQRWLQAALDIQGHPALAGPRMLRCTGAHTSLRGR